LLERPTAARTLASATLLLEIVCRRPSTSHDVSLAGVDSIGALIKLIFPMRLDREYSVNRAISGRHRAKE